MTHDLISFIIKENSPPEVKTELLNLLSSFFFENVAEFFYNLFQHCRWDVWTPAIHNLLLPWVNKNSSTI